MIKNIFILLCATFISIIVTACGGMSTEDKKNQALIESSGFRFKSCINTSINGEKSQCAVNFYNEIQAIQVNDYGKTAALKLATSFYTVLLKFDRSQIDSTQLQAEMMRIQNEFNMDLEDGRRKTVAENLEIAKYRQQVFLNTALLLNPPRNGINCVSINQGYVTTLNCR